MRIPFLFIATILLTGMQSFRNPAPDDNLIDWQSGQRLSWRDYQGEPRLHTGAVASTCTTISVDYNIGPDGFTYSVHCRFVKDKSWTTRPTAYILKHEQGHFDIAEIFARKLKAALAAYRFNRRTCESDLDRIYNKVIKEEQKMQALYDRETDHSINTESQADWLEKITVLLSVKS